MSSLWFIKDSVMLEMSMKGEGRYAWASSLLALVESLLPSRTCHHGPPSCIVILINYSNIFDVSYSSVEISPFFRSWTIMQLINTYHCNRVSGSDGQDVCARDHRASTSFINCCLHLVDYFESSNWIYIRNGKLFASKWRRRVQKNWSVTSLHYHLSRNSLSVHITKANKMQCKKYA